MLSGADLENNKGTVEAFVVLQRSLYCVIELFVVV